MPRALHRHRVWVVVVLAAFALAACAGLSFPPGKPKTIEEWLTSDTPSRAWTPIEPDRKIDLPPESVLAAAQLLYRDDAVQLDPENFARLLPGRDWPYETGRVPYLVRGVALDEPRGAVRVLASGDELLVQYEGPRVRARAIPLPVIVLMPAAPSNVYVRISLFD